MAKTRSLLAELRAAERRHGKFDSLELLIPDLSGVLRGKRIRPGDFEKSARDGFVFCAGATMLNTLGEVTSGVPYGADDGDPARACATTALGYAVRCACGAASHR